MQQKYSAGAVIIGAGIVGAFCLDVYLAGTYQFAALIATLKANTDLSSHWDGFNALGVWNPVVGTDLGRGRGAGIMYFFVSGMFRQSLGGMMWAAIYILASTRARVLRTQPIPCGAMFGLVVYFVTLGVVAFVTRGPVRAYAPLSVANDLLAHAVFFGVPVAWYIAHWLRPDT